MTKTLRQRFVIQSFGFPSSLVIRASSFSRSLSGKSGPHSRDDDERNANHDQKEREKLSARKTTDERRIRLAKIFQYDPKNRVADEKQSGQNSVWLPHSRAHEP